MFKSLCIGFLFCLMIFHGLSQPPAKPALSNVSYHPPSADKPSWQWLNLMLSATYFRVVKEGEVDFDSCLLYASRSLGLSRISVLGEDIGDPELFKQAGWIDQRVPAKGIRLLSQTRGKKRLEALLLLGAYYAFQPQRYYRKDSASYFLSRAIEEGQALKEEKLKRLALSLLGKMYFEVNDVKRGDSLFSHLVQESQAAGDPETEARAYFYWAFYPPYAPQTTSERIAHFQQAAGLYRELGNREGEINALVNAGYLLITTFKLPIANDAFLKSLELAETIHYPYTHYHTDALALVTLLEDKFGEPLMYALQTIRTAEAARDSIGWPYFYNRLGVMYQMEGGREEESLKWYFKALDRFLRAGDASLYLNLYNISGILRELGRGQEAFELVTRVSKQVPPTHPQDQIFYNLSLAHSYLGLKQYQKAEQYTLEAARLQKQFPTLRGAQEKSMITFLLGEIYKKMGQYERSQKFLEAYLSDPLRNRSFGNDVAAYSYLVAVDSALGNATAGLKRYWRYTQLLDSNFRVSKIRQEQELQVMYETQEKESQIALLNQQAQLEQANLKQATLVKNVTIAGIILAFVIAALLYRQSRQRKKINWVITRKNEQLEHLLTEKDWLLKEIHHRVKNNLQVVMSLLNSQTAYINNEPALTAIHDSQHRVHAMSLIHQKLYSSDNVSSIDMSIYIREMVSYLADSFDTGQRIRFIYDIEPIQMDVSQAVPLGLILNEAITNALKYAFPHNCNGEIAISLTHTNPRHCLLEISDNGIGMPSDFSTQKTSSLGMSLMRGLSEDLEGNFSIENRNGTIIKISFVHDRGVKRHTLSRASFASGN